jgi:hypothetical protein
LNGQYYCDRPKIPTIYTISHVTLPDLYVGQTIDFDSRRDGHFYKSRTGTQKLYTFLREHGHWHEWEMKRLREYPDATPLELDRLEWYWYKKLGATLNTAVPGHRNGVYRGSDEEFERVISSGAPRDPWVFSRHEINIF